VNLDIAACATSPRVHPGHFAPLFGDDAIVDSGRRSGYAPGPVREGGGELTVMGPEAAKGQPPAGARKSGPAELAGFALTVGALIVGAAYLIDAVVGQHGTLAPTLQVTTALAVMIGAGVFADPLIRRARRDMADLLRRVRRTVG
jgi:hypothetical protein